MKIAISATGKTMEGSLDSRFGRCKYFVIYDTESEEINVVENKGNTSGGGAGIAAAQQLIDEKIDTVITGHLGPNAFKVIKSAGIIPYQCESISIKSVLEKFKDGKLSKIKQAGKSHKGAGPGC